MSDFTVQNEGNIFLLHPHTAVAEDWLVEHFGNEDANAQFFGRALVIEHRYLSNIVAVVREEGFHVS